MKKLFKLTFACLIVLAASQTKAQVRVGPEAGLNLAKMTFKSSGIGITPSTLVTFHAGVDVEFKLTKSVFLQTGVLYSIKGTKYSEPITLGKKDAIANGPQLNLKDTQASSDFQISPNYIEVPIHFMAKFDMGNPKLFLLAGPYFAYGVGGKIKSGGESQNINFGNDDNSDLKPLDIGLDLGLGVEFSGLQISGRYGIGLADISTTSDVTIRNSVIQVSLAYMIGK